MEGLHLATLVEQLRPITRASGPLAVSEMEMLHALLDLPVYRELSEVRETLLADLQAVVNALPQRDDRVIARYLFRLEATDEEIGKRLKLAAQDSYIATARQVRALENYIMGQVAFGLYARAMSPNRSGWHHGDGYVFTDFTVDAFINEAMNAQTTRYAFTIQTVRNRVEFYKFGTLLKGSRPTVAARLLGDGRKQQLIASVPVDPRNPLAGHWHVVRFNPKLGFGETPTVVIEEDTERIEATDQQREFGFSIVGLDPVSRELHIQVTLLIQVHLASAGVSSYDRIIYDLAHDLMDRPISSTTVERRDDSPMTYKPDSVQPDRRYVVDWSSNSYA